MRTLLVILALTIGWALHGGEAGTNCIAIYLLDRPLAQPWSKLDNAHIKELKPVSPPVLADEDFLSFNTTNHSFVVSGAAATRLAFTIWSLAKKDAPGWGEQVPFVYRTGEFDLIPVPAPFVLHAGGEPIYAGAFYTSFSSAGFSGPVIMAEETFIKTNVSKSARFSFWIELGYPAALPGTPDPRNDNRIAELGYPAALPGTPDPRNDSRIASAVQKMFARRSAKP
jgi:hypothetical protein